MANLWGVGLCSLGYFLFMLCLDTYTVGYFVRRFCRPIAWRELLPYRAASYPLSLINYGAGQAAFAYALKKHYRVAVGDVIAIFTLFAAVDFFLVIAMAFMGSFAGEHILMGVEIAPTIQLVSYVTFALVAAHLAFWLMHWEDKVRGKFWKRLFAWLKRKSLFRIFHEANFRDYLTLALLRLPVPLMVNFMVFFAIRFFHAKITYWDLLVNVPVAMIVGTIPISWGGLGTANKVMVDLLGPKLTLLPGAAGTVSAAELILSMSLLWMLGNYLFKMIFGLIYMSRLNNLTPQEINPSEIPSDISNL